MGQAQRKGSLSSWSLAPPGPHSPLHRGFALYNAANLKSIDFHRKAEEKSLAQLKRQ